MLILLAGTGQAFAIRDYEIYDPIAAGQVPDATVPDSPNPGGDAATIDIALVYSRRFRQQLEGRGAYIADYALRSFEQINRYFSNTGLLTRIELVGLMEWNLPTGTDVITDHQRLIALMETQTRSRDEFSADLIQLWEVPEAGVDDPAICGWGQVIGPNRQISTSGFGYTAVLQGQRNTAYAGCYADASPEGFARIMAHEFGHNFGSTHARGEGSGQGVFEFSHGKLCGAPENSFPVGTLMSVSGYALDFFSTPLRSEDGESCGVPEGQPEPADNRETFTRTVSVIAGLRSEPQGLNQLQAVVPSDIGEANGSLPVTLVRTGAASGASVELLVFEQGATRGVDFVAPPSQIVSFATGQLTATVNIPLLADNRAEGAEGLLIFLQRPRNLAIAGQRAFAVDIQDGLVSGLDDIIQDALDALPPLEAGGGNSGTPPSTDSPPSTGGGGGGGGGAAIWPALLLAASAAGRRRRRTWPA